MRITEKQLRRIIKETLLLEAIRFIPEVQELQKLMGIPRDQQDGRWGPITDAAWREFVVDKVEGRQLKDPAGNYLASSDTIADKWDQYGAKLAGGSMLGKDFHSSLALPKDLTGDAKGALKFAQFLTGFTASTSTRRPTMTATDRWDMPGQNLSQYPGYTYDMEKIWAFYESPENFGTNLTPQQILEKYPEFRKEINARGWFYVFGTSSQDTMDRVPKLEGGKPDLVSCGYKIDDMDTLKKFFKKDSWENPVKK